MSYSDLADLCTDADWGQDEGRYSLISCMMQTSARDPALTVGKVASGHAASKPKISATASNIRHGSWILQGGMEKEAALVITDGVTVLLLAYSAPPLPPLLLLDTALLRQPSFIPSTECGEATRSAATSAGAVTSMGMDPASTGTGVADAASIVGSDGSTASPPRSTNPSAADVHLTLRATTAQTAIGLAEAGSARSAGTTQPSSATSAASSKQGSTVALMTMPPTPLAAALASQKLFSPLQLLRHHTNTAVGTSGG